MSVCLPLIFGFCLAYASAEVSLTIARERPQLALCLQACAILIAVIQVALARRLPVAAKHLHIWLALKTLVPLVGSFVVSALIGIQQWPLHWSTAIDPILSAAAAGLLIALAGAVFIEFLCLVAEGTESARQPWMTFKLSVDFWATFGFGQSLYLFFMCV